MTNQVEDKKTERNILWNNIISGCILASILWVGDTIDSIKDDIRDVVSRQMVNIATINSHTNEIVELKARVSSLEKPRTK